MRIILICLVSTAAVVFVCCSEKSTASFANEPCEPMGSADFAIHDSTQCFYENQFVKMIEFAQGAERSAAIFSRGYAFDLKVSSGVLNFKNRVRDEFQWWIEGKSELSGDKLRFQYIVQSPGDKT